MKLSTREDIDASLPFVFAHMADFDHFEQLLITGGAEVQRHSDTSQIVGAEWTVAADIRGQRREIGTKIAAFSPDECYTVISHVSGLRCETQMDVTALPRNRTRLHLSMDFRPETLGGRVLLQSMKLAKAKLTQGFKSRVARHARNIAEAYRA